VTGWARVFVAVVRRGLAAKPAVGPVVVVVVLPFLFLEFLVEQAGVVLNDAVEQSAEFFGVDAVRTLHFSVDVAAVGVHVKRWAPPGTPLKEDSKFSSDVQLATLWPSQMCGGYTSCSCRRDHACSSGTVFVTVTVRAARCRKPTSIAGNHGRSQRRCARTPDPRCTASDKPYTALVPTAPLESDHRDSNCGSPCEGKFGLATFSSIAGTSALNMAGPQWVYAIFHG